MCPIVGRCRAIVGLSRLVVRLFWFEVGLTCSLPPPPPIPPSPFHLPLTSLIYSPTDPSREMPKVVMRETPPLSATDKSRTLKRTSSNASLASLPTPPGTIHKRKRSGSRASSVYESGDESDACVSDRRAIGKRRKVVHTREVEVEVEEELFWAGVTPPANKPSTSAKPGPVTRSTTKSPEESPKMMTRTQYKESRAMTITGLQSPPPSRRQPARKVKKPVTPQPLVAPRTPRTPRTPRVTTRGPGKTVGKGKGKATKEMPVRDSPNNPFLDEPEPLALPRFKTPEPKAPVLPLEERKTVTYVL
jgi:hypothetical protein